MNKKLLIFGFSVITLSSTLVQASPENSDQKILTKPLRVNAIKDEKVQNSEPREKMNLLRTFKNENSGPEDRIKKEAQGKKNSSKPASCLNTVEMMDKRISVLNSNLAKRKAITEKVSNLLTIKLTFLKSKGEDTSALETALTTYTNSMKDLVSQRTTLINTLSDLTKVDCSTDDLGFKTKLKEFNQSFRNQNLDFNKLNKDLRVNLFYPINNLLEKYKTVSTSEESSR